MTEHVITNNRARLLAILELAAWFTLAAATAWDIWIFLRAPS